MNKQRIIQALILAACVLNVFCPELFPTYENVENALLWWAGLLIAGVVGGAGAYSSYKQYESQQRQAEYRQQMAEYNAEVQQQKARREEQAAIRRELEVRRQGQATIGKQRSLLAQSGVSMTQGSPLETLAETSADIEHEVEVASFEGKMRARSRRSAAEQSEARATLAGERADTAGTMKYVGAARSGVQGFMGAGGGSLLKDG